MTSLVQLKSGLFVPPEAMQQKALSSVDDSRYWQVLYDYGTSMSAWQKDITIDHEGVLANWANFSCQTLIAGDIGKCNLDLWVEDGEIWTKAYSPSFSPVIRKPNHYQTRQQFIETWILSKLSWGNAYILKERDNRGIVIALYVLDPARARPLVSDRGDVFYQLNRDDLSGLYADFPAVPASEIIHDRFNCLFHPLVGLSPIFASGLAATQGLKIATNSAKFFENMSRPSGLLTAPGPISDAVAERLKTNWDDNYAGKKIGKVAVLGDGLKYESMGVTAVDAQMVEQAKFSGETVCSTYHVPAFKIGIGSIPAGQKVEDMNQIYYSDCLHSLMDAVQTLSSEGVGLDTPKDGKNYAYRFDLDDLLKMDSQTLVNVIQAGINAAVMSPNEGRKRMNLPPVAGGEAPLSQQQNWSLAQLADRSAIQDKPSVAAPEPEETEAEERQAFIQYRAEQALRKAMAA